MSKELILIPKERFQHLLELENSQCDRTSSMSKDNHQHNTPESMDFIWDMIEASLPSRWIKRARGLYVFVCTHCADVISFDQYGQICVSKQTIEGSHIVDIIKFALCPLINETPKGYREFYTILKQKHAPDTILSKKPVIRGNGEMFVRGPQAKIPGRKNKSTNVQWINY